MTFRVFKDTLASGLTVVTVETKALHSAMAAVYVRVGSRHETVKTNGVSHVLEHLFFRGSKRYPDSVQMNAAVEAAGGNLNGVTMRDSSYFYTPIHPGGVDVALRILGDMLTQPRLVQLETEKRVILEEMLDEVDERGRDIDVDNLAKRQLYGTHPLSFKIAGTTETVKKLTMREVKEHFAKFYVTGNVVVAVGGPVKREDVVKRVRQSFAKLPRGPRVEETPPVVLAKSEPALSYVTLDESQVEFRLTFPAFAENHPDHTALGLLRRVLDDGLSSRLPHRIVEKRGLAYSIGATLESFHDTGTFDVDGACAPEHLGPVVEECLRTLATLRAGKMTREELTRAQTRYAMHLDFLQDSPGDLCGWFGGTELFRPAETFAQRAEAARAVPVKDLQRVASAVLTHAALHCIAVGPKSAKAPLQKVIARAASLLRS